MSEEDSLLTPKSTAVNGDSDTGISKRNKLVLIASILCGTLLLLLPFYHYHDRKQTIVVLDEASNSNPTTTATEETTTEDQQEQLYRDACHYYHYPTKQPVRAPPRIIQTSMHQASQPWSHLDCTLAAPHPDVVTLNAASAPDAILATDFMMTNHTSPSILGFGGAFTEATALNFQRLPTSSQETVLELLFGSTGLGYSLGRVPVHSCDFSVESFTFDDTEDDITMDQFDTTLQHDVDNGLIDLLQRAATKYAATHTAQELRLLASPWSPPAWMKRPTWQDRPDAVHASNMTYSATPNCLRSGTGPDSIYATAWANYIATWLESYDSHYNVSFWAVTVQNEPEFAAPWEACAYNAWNMAEFVAHHLGPRLSSTTTNPFIFAFDHNKDHVVDWMDTMLNKNENAAQYISGTAYHWYAGGMDRLLDGALGIANMHRLREFVDTAGVSDDQHLILGSEACHCPTTGYAGGDVAVVWTRAERYAHTVLADLAAGSQGWIEWNLVLDSIGGPNHLGNLCDAPILAVPQRVWKNGTTDNNLSPLPPFEKHSPMGDRIVGDDRTREELNALGFPAEYIDQGIVVQPLFYYMGHISKYVRPGSRAVPGLVMASATIGPQNNDAGHTFRPVGATVAGGGENNLARNGIELLVWPCEGSTRQQFRWESNTIRVSGHDWLGNPTESCAGRQNDRDFQGIRLTDCKKAGKFALVPASESGVYQVKLLNSLHRQPEDDLCLAILKLKNDGGSYGPLGGAQVRLGSCTDASALWTIDLETGTASSNYFSTSLVCMTTGWPFLQMGAFVTPKNERVVVVLNEAQDTANYALQDGKDVVLTNSIPPRSIQTILLD